MNTEMMVTMYGAGAVGYLIWAALDGHASRFAQALLAARHPNLTPAMDKALTAVLATAVLWACGAAWPVAMVVAQWKTRRPAASDTTA